MHSAGGVAGSQRLDLGNADQIEVVLDAVLEAGSGYREIDGVLRGLSVQHGIDKARAEGVAAADAVNDADVVGRGEVSLAAGIQHGRPIVVAGRDRAAQRDGDGLEAEARAKLLGFPAAMSVPDAAMPNTSLASSSLAMQTST